MLNTNGLPKVFGIYLSMHTQGGGEERVRKRGRKIHKSNKIQYTVLTAAQYIHRRARKTSSIDAMTHIKVTFQYLFNKLYRAGSFL
jgi:Holliday junction resolvase RusA-like endonuclease